MPELVIKRRKQFFAPANCCFHVYIDNVKRTTLSNGDQETLKVDQGVHTLQINNNYFKGKRTEVHLDENESIQIKAYSRPILGWLYILTPVFLLIFSILRLLHVPMNPLVMSIAMAPLFLFIVLAVILGTLRKAIVVKQNA